MNTATDLGEALAIERHPHVHRPLNELATALAKTQAALKTVGTDKEVKVDSAKGSYKYKYADLATIWDACREALTANGLSIVQQPCSDGARVGVTTTLLHSSGQSMTSTIYTTPRDQGPQAMGSALTYLRRYSLAAIVGIASGEEDDDGQAAERAPAPANDNGRRVATKLAQRPSDPPPAAADQPASSSLGKPTLKAMRQYQALRDELGLSGDEARARVSKFLGRDVESMSDVTAAELGRIIDAMEGQKNASA